EWTRWLPSERFLNNSQNLLKLSEVNTEEKWKEMYKMRISIEKEFGITDESEVKRIVDDIKKKARELKGKWFLAKAEGKTVGEIGILPFEFEGKQVGRLQDVDIISNEQGKGYGNELLAEACIKAKKMNLNALCLMAKSDDWPKEWYLRFGFVKIGER
ncbi:MAG: GNAT family N-acetyltransferase, partial [Bdellovibrionales bacterium]|nr:GNAT family N-acetyltransferase [Bdellovibrionales bacterium]